MSQNALQYLRYTLLALLIVWGGYTLFAYLGVPVHMSVLINGTDKTLIEQSCGPTELFCAGWRALIPTFTYTMGRMGPFMVYIIVSLLGLGALYVKRYLSEDEWGVRIRMTPWKMALAFIASLWLLFTTLSYGIGSDGQPLRRLFEPVPQVYVGAGAEAMQALKENFSQLEGAGCLNYLGQTNHGAGIYDISGSCMQMSFITRVLPLLLSVAVLLFAFAVLGRLLLSLFRMHPQRPMLELLFSVGLGASGMIFLLWSLALAGIYTANAGWVLLIVVFAAGWRHALYWIRRFLHASWEIEADWKSGAVLLGWLLISYLALNFLTVVRPFPIGWDDLGRYINQPRLLVSYGHFIPSLAVYQWEYVSSLGFLLFGYDNVFGATLAMEINWLAGLLSVFLVYVTGAVFLGRGRGVLAALVYYTLPMVGHFSFADMKVDNAVFFMGSLGILSILLALFPMADEEGEEVPLDWRWLVLAGVFAGMAFSLKPTSIMMITATLTMLLGVVHWSGFVGGFFLTWALYLTQGQLSIGQILGRIGYSPDLLGRWTAVGICAVIGIGALAYAATVRRRAVVLHLRATLIIAGTTLLCISPWLINNNIQAGNVIPRIIFSVPNKITPDIAYRGVTQTLDAESRNEIGQLVRTLPAELAVDPDNAACVNTSKAEELDRYWGYGSGWRHYLTLPWRVVMNADSAGYYITLVPALLLVPLLLLMPYAWTRRGRWARWLTFATLFGTAQWVLLANGIPWYGLGVFFGLAVALEVLVARSPDKSTRIASGFFVGFSVLIALAMRVWQFEQQSNLLEYPIGKVTAEAMQERTIPDYDDVREIAMQRFETMKDRPYVYRVGTFIPYFIPRNLEVLPVADHQLDTFNCLFQERNPALTLRRLEALGFNSIIFDTNTHTIEQDPNGSLHKKVERFVEFINTTSLGLRIVVNDPGNGIAYILLPDKVSSAPTGSGSTVR